MIACLQCSNSEKIVKNEIKKNKSQSFLCKNCRKQFVDRNNKSQLPKIAYFN